MIPVADSMSKVADVFFLTELVTTLCTKGMMLQIRQEAISPPTNENKSSHAIEADQMIDVSQNNSTVNGNAICRMNITRRPTEFEE